MEFAKQQLFQRRNALHRDTMPAALISVGSVGEAIADDPCVGLLQTRPDLAFAVLVPGGKHQ